MSNESTPEKSKIPTEIPDTIELRKIKTIIEDSKELLGNFSVVPVDNAGYILQSELHKPITNNGWVFFDYDDTLARSFEEQNNRHLLYLHLLKTLNLEITVDQAEKIMQLTDDFSRWKDDDTENRRYHANVHLTTLCWYTNTLRNNPNAIYETIEDLNKTLVRIKKQVEPFYEQKDENQNEEMIQLNSPQDSDPFYFRKKDKKFILRDLKNIWSKDFINENFNTIVNPPKFSETLEAAKILGNSETSVNGTNIGVFTSGLPDFQLIKILNLMKENPDLRISQIWLTRIPKGDFIKKIIEKALAIREDLDLPTIQEDNNKSEFLELINILGLTKKKNLTIVDDNPGQLQSILAVNKYLISNTGSKIVVVRTINNGTRAEKQEWEPDTPHGELDFTKSVISAQETANYILPKKK